MGKRSSFERKKNDSYYTPLKPVTFLIPFISDIKSYAEPCAGGGDLIRHLNFFGKECTYSADIETGTDALETPPRGEFDAIITNPPWSRYLLHPMIYSFQKIAPTWLLFDADWKHTRQAAPMLDNCSHIVTVGRVKWIAKSKHSGKDNAAWYRFDSEHSGGPKFYGYPIQKTLFDIDQ